NNKGTVDPRTAAQAAAAFGIKIYTIGVGTQGEAPVPTGQGPLGLRYETMPVKIDEQLLDEVAHTTGGRYFRATDAASLSNIFGEINRLGRTRGQHLVYHRYEEAYRVPLGLGLLALALELVLAGTFAVRVPLSRSTRPSSWHSRLWSRPRCGPWPPGRAVRGCGARRPGRRQRVASRARRGNSARLPWASPPGWRRSRCRDRVGAKRASSPSGAGSTSRSRSTFRPRRWRQPASR